MRVEITLESQKTANEHGGFTLKASAQKDGHVAILADEIVHAACQCVSSAVLAAPSATSLSMCAVTERAAKGYKMLGTSV